MHLKKIHVSIIWYFIITSGKKSLKETYKWTSVGAWEAKYHTNFPPWLYEEMVSFMVPLKMIEEFLLLFLFCLEIRLVLNLAMYSESKVDSIFLADFYMWQKKKKEESCKEKKRSERGYPNSNTFHLISAALPSVS